jgi:hypothetical protein
MSEINNQEYAKHMLRVAITNFFAELRGQVAAHIRAERLLWMPSAESLSALGNSAKHFTNHGSDPDGDSWLAPTSRFSKAELTAALNVGGKIVDGYAFWYPHTVEDRAHTRRGWCGYNAFDIGYALSRDVAESICQTSITLARVRS